MQRSILLFMCLCTHVIAVALNDFLAVKKKGSRKPRLSEPTVATLKLHVQQSPVQIIRPSPTPISPSYKAKTNTKVNQGLIDYYEKRAYRCNSRHRIAMGGRLWLRQSV